MKIRDACQVIGMLEHGDLAAELTDELGALIAACRDSAGQTTIAKGELVLKLAVAVQGVQITLTGEIASKPPKAGKRQSSVYFLTPDGEISTEHPQQMSLFPRDAKERDAQ